MNARSALILCLPCAACSKNAVFVLQPSRTEEHHLNLGGHAGQKRLGDDFSIPLCGWHHRGEPSRDRSKTEMAQRFGPSLAAQSKLFRSTYGTDEVLLAETNVKLKWRSGEVKS